MTLVQLFRISPLGCVGTFLLGGVYAGIFGMGSVFGTEMGLTVAQISAFVAAIYAGGLVFQYPIGWISDRMDRRILIMGLTAAGALVTLVGGLFSGTYAVVLILGFIIGGVANPLYSLIIAYTNDFLQPSDMAAASGGLLFINGLGAMTGPVLIGALMTRFGGDAFFAYIGTLFALIAALCALPHVEAAGAGGRGDHLLRAGAAARPRRSRSRSRRRSRSSGPARRPPAAEAASLFARARRHCLANRREAAWIRGRRKSSSSGSNEVGPDGWYRADPAIDSTIRERWLPLWETGRAGGLREWSCSPLGCLALLVLLDQFPRNMFRDDPRAFASDARAVTVAKTAILHGVDRRVGTPERQFFYTPLHAFRDAEQPGQGGAALPAEFRQGRAPPPCPRPSRHHPPLRPLPLPQRRARPREHGGGAGLHRRRGLPGGLQGDAAVSRAALAAAREMG